jgi:hypothetical protein
LISSTRNRRRPASKAGLTRTGRWLLFHSFVVTKSSSRRSVPALMESSIASPTASSFRYRFAQSRWRNPTSSAVLVASLVARRSGISVPKPTAESKIHRREGFSNSEVCRGLSCSHSFVLRASRAQTTDSLHPFGPLAARGFRRNRTKGLTTSMAIMRILNWSMTAMTAA